MIVYDASWISKLAQSLETESHETVIFNLRADKIASRTILSTKLLGKDPS